jgi:hypothetical protein
MDTVSDLLITETAAGKLAARGISEREAQQLLANANVTVRDFAAPADAPRRLLIGRTDGGRTLTLVIERTVDPTTWLVITGWDSAERERRLLG